ncbi:aldose 1-epimerase [Aquisalimonas asiatica]|uniref:Aldose 1-epimerase n=1 Tax=Aquisalimonas asiatica TaxID=406100 RepID=A0A1H8UNZ7_9GAMM|nr:aldose 1-epimerase [Aquisalimonas asiatica]SEP04703.1 aldose 1-epimerase [Aquisalimonas asiatica]
MAIILDNGQLRLTVDPSAGGSVSRFDALTRSGPVPLMRPSSPGERDPMRLALFPLVPWSNRIAGGEVPWRGRRYGLAANRPGEPLPIHGDGWQQPWWVSGQEADWLRLTLRSREQPPFDYQAELIYRLAGTSLVVDLAVTHKGAGSAPYGLGLHPWFPRSADVRLEAPADGVWDVDADQLPSGWRALGADDPWDFRRPAPLPRDRIDNLFTGWDGRARLHWPARGVALEVTADVSHYLVFSPGQDADVFCFEPVSHVVNAHHLGAPEHGLVELHTGERYASRYCFSWVAGGDSGARNAPVA